MESCTTCRELLGEGLDLCVRARDMDSRDRRQATLSASSTPKQWEASDAFDRHVDRHNIARPEAPISSRGATVRLWEQEQYDKDLFDWENKSRRHLMQGCGSGRAALAEQGGADG